MTKRDRYSYAGKGLMKGGRDHLPGVLLFGIGLLAMHQPVLGQTAEEAETVAAEQEKQELQQYNDLSLPTAAAPAAYGVGLESGMPVGQNTQQAISHPPGVVGGVEGFYPSLTIGYRWWTNPQKTLEGEEVDDNSLFIQPVLLYRGTINNRHPYELIYSGSYDRFDEFANLDYDQSLLGAAIKLDMTEKAMLDLYGSYIDGADQRGAANTRVITDPLADNDKYERSTVGGRFTLGRRTNPLQLVLGSEYSTVDYKNNGQQVRDRDNTLVPFGVYWNITGKTSLFLNGYWNDIRYKDAETARDFDSDETSVTLGLGWEPTYATSVLLQAGNLQKKFDSPEREDYDGLTYLGKVSWNPRYNTTIGLYASRRTEETTIRDSSYLLEEAYGLNIGYAFNQRLSLRGFVDKINDDYQDARGDDITGYGLGASYNMTRWLNLGLDWQRYERDSTDPLADYDSDVFSITATFMRQPAGKLGDPNIQTTDELRATRQ